MNLRCREIQSAEEKYISYWFAHKRILDHQAGIHITKLHVRTTLNHRIFIIFQMKFPFVASALALCALASAAPSSRRKVLTGTAILQFEIAPDTFISDTEITIGTQIDTDLSILSASIASTSGVANPGAIVCELMDQSTVVGKFTVNKDATFKNLQTVTAISCSD